MKIWACITLVFSWRIQIKIQNPIDHEVLLDSVIPLPVSDNGGSDEVSHLTNAGLEWRGQVGGQEEAEGEVVNTRRQTRSIVQTDLLGHVALVIVIVIMNSLCSAIISSSSCDSSMEWNVEMILLMKYFYLVSVQWTLPLPTSSSFILRKFFSELKLTRIWPLRISPEK